MADNRSKRGRGIRFGRLLTLAGLALAFTAMVRVPVRVESARGRPATPPSPQALGSGYEPKDIDARGTAFILASMAAATALVIGVVFVMVWRFDTARHAAFAHLTPPETAQAVPPAPHLQVDPFADLAQVKSREARLLQDYGWTSPDHSTARIPIDRAMALSVGKSLDAPP